MPPGERTFRRVLGEVDGDQLDREVCAYLAGQEPRPADAPGHPDTPGAARPDTAEPAEPAWSNEREARRVRRRNREHPAMVGLLPAAAADGKAVRGARRPDGRRLQLLSLFCHTRHATLAQRAIDAKTSEVPELKPLIAEVDLAGTVLTADALHAVRETARHLTEDLGAYYVLILKHNQPVLLATAMTVLAEGTDAEHERAGTGHTEIDRGHGRSERRTIRTAPADGVDFPGAVQVMRIVRHVADLHGAGSSKEVAYAITNLPADLAGPAHLGTYVRRHWGWKTASTTSGTSPSVRTPARSVPAACPR